MEELIRAWLASTALKCATIDQLQHALALDGLPDPDSKRLGPILRAAGWTRINSRRGRIWVAPGADAAQLGLRSADGLRLRIYATIAEVLAELYDKSRTEVIDTRIVRDKVAERIGADPADQLYISLYAKCINRVVDGGRLVGWERRVRLPNDPEREARGKYFYQRIPIAPVPIK